MENKILEHIEEYEARIREHQKAIVALSGAIQALRRLQEEKEDDVESDDVSDTPE